jgi:hypothetical protein
MQKEIYVVYDLAHYPRHIHNEEGGIVFGMHPAKLLLREDIKANLHLTTYKTHKKLQALRTEYHLFDSKLFSEIGFAREQIFPLPGAQHWRMKHSDGVRYLSSCPEMFL